jgi:hypothetical protein
MKFVEALRDINDGLAEGLRRAGARRRYEAALRNAINTLRFAVAHQLLKDQEAKRVVDKSTKP